MAAEGAEEADQISFDKINGLAQTSGQEFVVDTVDGAQGFDPSKFEGFGPGAGPETENVIDEVEEAQEPLAEDIDKEEQDEEHPQEPQDKVVEDATEEEDVPTSDGEPSPRRKPQDDDDNQADVGSTSSGLSQGKSI
jgi:hypothetical protein